MSQSLQNHCDLFQKLRTQRKLEKARQVAEAARLAAEVGLAVSLAASQAAEQVSASYRLLYMFVCAGFFFVFGLLSFFFYMLPSTGIVLLSFLGRWRRTSTMRTRRRMRSACV